MTAIETIYDFETAIEEAFRTALAAQSLTAYTVTTIPTEDGEAASEFQKKRPRVVVSFAPGAAKGMLLAESGYKARSGELREQAYAGTLTVEVVTAAAIATHRAYRATVRSVMDTICRTVNVLPAKHCVQRVKAASTSDTYSSDQGAYVSRLQYEVDFSVQTDAWADLV